MKTVAIVGGHPDTRSMFDWEREDCDVWIFNEALKGDWCKRADAVFQMHQPTIWRASTNRNDPKHYEWLQQQDNPTIWMIDQFEDVPKSEKYPLEEVLALVPRFGYFTSSVAYAIALAIYQQYDRIEVYGVEMETGTEYSHQRTGVAFWLGVAVGRGIDVEHYTYKFWKAPLYGYEGNARIEIEWYEKRIDGFIAARDANLKKYEAAMKTVADIVGAFVKSYKADQSHLDDAIIYAGQCAHDFGMIDGAMQVNEKYLEKSKAMLDETGDYMIVRQEYEGNAHAGLKMKQEEFNHVHVNANLLGQHRKKLLTSANMERRQWLAKEFKRLFDKYIEKSTMTGVGNGIFMENREMLKLYDQLLNAEGTLEQEVGGEKMPVAG